MVNHDAGRRSCCVRWRNAASTRSGRWRRRFETRRRSNGRRGRRGRGARRRNQSVRWQSMRRIMSFLACQRRGLRHLRPMLGGKLRDMFVRGMHPGLSGDGSVQHGVERGRRRSGRCGRCRRWHRWHTWNGRPQSLRTSTGRARVLHGRAARTSRRRFERQRRAMQQPTPDERAHAMRRSSHRQRDGDRRPLLLVLPRRLRIAARLQL